MIKADLDKLKQASELIFEVEVDWRRIGFWHEAWFLRQARIEIDRGQDILRDRGGKDVCTVCPKNNS